jgi:putative oxidoreductase
MSTFRRIGRGLGGLAFAGAAAAKFTRNEMMTSDFDRFGYPPWFMQATGAAEAAGAAGMLIGAFSSMLAKPAGVLLTGVMLGALASHLRAKDPPHRLIPPAILLGLIATATLD